MSDGASRRRFIQMGTVAVAASLTASPQLTTAQTQAESDDVWAAPLLVGPTDARPEPSSEFFDDKAHYAYVYQPTDASTKWVLTDEDDQWSDLASSGIWSDTDGDGLAELPNHDGIDIGWAGLGSFTEEEGSFDVSTSGEQTVTFQNTYLPGTISSGVGANQGDGNASWFGWQRDADGNITGMQIAYGTGTFSSATVRWHVSGNQTQGSYTSG